MEKNILAAIGTVVIAAVLVLGLLVFMQPQAPQCTAASGPIVSRNIPLGAFTKIEASGQIELYLKQDDLGSVAIEAPESIAGLVFAEAQNGTLLIGLGGLPGTTWLCALEPQASIKVFVSAANIESITAADSAKVFTENRIYRERLFLEAFNSALIDTNVSVDDLNSFASSFGTIILAGSAEKHSAKAVTGGKIIADRLETAYGFFEAHESGSIVALVFDEASATAKTGGSIGIGGGAAITSNVTESGGTVTEVPGSGGNDGNSGTEGGAGTGDEGEEGPEGEGSDGGDLPDGETPPGIGEEPAVCGNDLIEAPEECESYLDCAADEECSECECVMLPADPGAKIMSPEACTTPGRNMVCGESPVCPPDAKNVGTVESDGLPCICCVSA